ncbi:HNH endonuclease [Micromonospora sp. LAH09]|uniref:HNH endonuclease signature motif containing protein n=1 Tax=Micromonospora cabrerizensis TaxID=2911213 RepID=UPI001EE98DEF|nr:HNH endonuclease signature motif containing protein [Micromonospora cabrerizensis]MCG5469686.1 HNH endonuclease [Micromonospora cabrerizensis]
MAIQRDVLVEAGHRCAIPTCRQVPTELAHIDPWSKVQEHTFANIIALCPTCHSRYDQGQIDRQSMLQYKANLSVLNHRYGDLERRLLELFAAEPKTAVIQLPGGFGIMLSYLIQDALLVPVDMGGNRGYIMGMPAAECFGLTEKGREFVTRWAQARPVD